MSPTHIGLWEVFPKREYKQGKNHPNLKSFKAYSLLWTMNALLKIEE